MSTTKRPTKIMISGKLDCFEVLQAMVRDLCKAPAHAEVQLSVEALLHVRAREGWQVVVSRL